MEDREQGLRKAARSLVEIPYLYSGYNVKHGCVIGCIFEALEIIAPDVAEFVKEGDGWDAWDKAYVKFFEEDEDPAPEEIVEFQRDFQSTLRSIQNMKARNQPVTEKMLDMVIDAMHEADGLIYRLARSKDNE